MYEHIQQLEKAWRFASQKHKDQTYAGDKVGLVYPYLTHLGLVWNELVMAFQEESSGDKMLAYTCAILHDTIEDTDATYEEINQLFGQEVADGVMALTKNELLTTKKAKMADSLLRIKQQPKEVWMVKLADRIVNLSPPPNHWSQEKIGAYREEAYEIYHQLADAHKSLAKRLRYKIEEYQQYL